MKKFFAVLLVGGIAFASCKKDKSPIDCTTAANNITKAAQAYGTAPTKENCQAYKAALNDLINNSTCSGSLSASDKELYNAALSSLTCEDR